MPPAATASPRPPKRRNRTTAKERTRRLREQVNTVGQRGKPGERVRNVISVGMLTEGWDAKTVTHIMGLPSISACTTGKLSVRLGALRDG